MKTLAELAEIRKRMQGEINTRDGISASDIKVVVGMATCGIAAGARPVLTAFNEEVTKRGLSNIKVTQTGCIGMCRLEPIVEVIAPDGNKITYIHMNPDKARRVVEEHIIGGKPIADFTAQE